MKLRANIVMVNFPSDDIGKSRDFFSRLLGIELTPALWEQDESYHAPISSDGIDLDINPRHHPQETPTVYFAVDDLDSTLKEVQSNGGKVLWGPEDLPMSQQAAKEYKQIYDEEYRGGPPPTNSLGRGSIILEPGGTQVGLVQLEEHVHEHFSYGRHQKDLTDKQVRVNQKVMQRAKNLRLGKGKQP
ncbi:MAG: hypothetical protein JOZ51_02275 [Chloroflexi bacterium]|nr:hypothetical protein [Chloroflexota bacterium]